MGLISNIRRITEEDYDKDDRPLIRRLSSNLNEFMEEVIDVVNGNLDFSNMKRYIVTTTIKVDASGNIVSGGKIRLNNTNKIYGMTCLRAINIKNLNQFVTGYPFISWLQRSQVVEIKNVTNIPANSEFTLTIEIVEK
jgi:hypothetical protein